MPWIFFIIKKVYVSCMGPNFIIIRIELKIQRIFTFTYKLSTNKILVLTVRIMLMSLFCTNQFLLGVIMDFELVISENR